MDADKRIVSLLCPRHAIGYSGGCDFNDTLTLENITTVSQTWEITAEKTIQSLQCSNMTIGVSTGSKSINEIWSSQFITPHSLRAQNSNPVSFSLSAKEPEIQTFENETETDTNNFPKPAGPKAGLPVVALIGSTKTNQWHKKHQRIQINKGPFAMKNRAGKVLGLLDGACPFEKLELQRDNINNLGQQFYSMYKKDGDSLSLFSAKCPGLAIAHNIGQNLNQVSMHPYVIENKDLRIGVNKDTNHHIGINWRLRHDGAIESAKFPGLLFHVDSRNEASNAIFLANQGDIGDGSVHSWRQINTRCEVDGLLFIAVAFYTCI